MSAGAFLRAVNGGDGSYAVLPVPQMGHLHVSHTHTYPFFGFSTLGCWSNAGTEANPLSLSRSLFLRNGNQLTSCISEVWDLYEFLLYWCLLRQSDWTIWPQKTTLRSRTWCQATAKACRGFFSPGHSTLAKSAKSCVAAWGLHAPLWAPRTNSQQPTPILSLSTGTCIPIHLSIYSSDAELLVRDACQCNAKTWNHVYK